MRRIYSVPYILWLGLFVIAPVLMIIYQSFFDMNGQFTLNNYLSYFTSGTSLSMTINSVWYAFLITFFTLIISYPTAYFLTKLKHKQLWLMLIILPTWVNLLLKAYAFIGIFSVHGSVNHFFDFIGMGQTDIIHRLQFSVRGNVYRDSIYDYANFQCIGRDESFFDQC